ncbi:MAG: sensor histidine kinase [Candidatus Hodarchaeota archaeon]
MTLQNLYLSFVYVSNTILSLLFFFMGLFYLLDGRDLRTQKNKALLIFFLSITGYHLTHFLYISLYGQEGVDLFNTVTSVLTIISITSLLISLFLFIVLDTEFPHQDLITNVIIGICLFFGLFSLLRYLIYDRGTLLLSSVFQLFLTDMWFFSFLFLAESIIGFFVVVCVSPKFTNIFFPKRGKFLVNREYLNFFAVGVLLGGIGEVIKAIGITLDFLIVGGLLNTIGLTIVIFIIVITRKYIRDIAWQIIEVQLEELKELDEIKNQLMDFASHEVRTPLSIMWGNIELLRRAENNGELTKEQRQKIFNAIERNYKRIEKLIDINYDLSRLRRGLFDLEKEPVDLREIIPNTVHNMQNFVEKNDLTITYEIENNNSFDIVMIDPDRIDQVLRNLIENSVKFSESGNIVVRLVNTLQEYIVSVKDEGRGINPDNFIRIFEPYRNENVTKNRGRGLGLGLYISRSIIELHQGKMWVKSDGEGKGSTFYFSIPKKLGV